MSRTVTGTEEPADPAAGRRTAAASLPRPPAGPGRALAAGGPGAFSFLGMRAILVLCFADTAANGGPEVNPGTAASVSAAYGTMVYLVSVADGWLADRVLGSYRAVLRGGVLIACGRCATAAPPAAMHSSPGLRPGEPPVTKIIGGCPVFAALATLLAPWLRRTTHPVTKAVHA